MASVAEATKPLTMPLPPGPEPESALGPTHGETSFPLQPDGSQPLVSRIRWSGQSIEIYSETLFSTPLENRPEQHSAINRLLERLFSDSIVGRVAVDRQPARMTIHLADGYLTSPANLERITKLFSGRGKTELAPPLVVWETTPSGSFEVVRDGQILTTWQVAETSPRQWAIRQPSLKHNRHLGELAVSFTEQLPYIKKAKIDRRHGLLLLKLQPGRQIDRASLIHSLEQLSSDAHHFLLPPPYPRAEMTMPLATLAVAAYSQWWNPAFWWLAGGMVVWVNRQMIIQSFKDLRHGVVSLPMLTTLIVLGTALGGAFVASALIAVTARLWQNQYAGMLNSARREWLGQLIQPSGTVHQLEARGTLKELPVGRLKPGDVIEIKAGTRIAADGECLEGSGKALYWYGRREVTSMAESSRVYAGGLLESGRLRVRVSRTAANTRMAKIRHELLETTGTNRGKASLNCQGQHFAEKTVLPTLAMAGIGLATLDVNAAVAVMRPDYATGVGMGQGIERLRLASEAIAEGFLVRDPHLHEKAATINIWLMEQPVNCFIPPPGQYLAMLSSPDCIDLRRGEETLTLQGFAPIRNDVDRMRLIQLLRDRGLSVAWVGDAVRFPNTARFADIAISTNTEPDYDKNPTAILSLDEGVIPWARALDLLTENQREARHVRNLALVPNILAVAGAFTMGFTSLASVVLTNLGIFTVFSRTRARSPSTKVIHHERST
jgi:hypothetical protein